MKKLLIFIILLYFSISYGQTTIDTDGDGISNSEDRCPNEAGTPYFQGCPDTDGDGIPDIDDACPMASGLKEDDGCPLEKVYLDCHFPIIIFDLNSTNISKKSEESIYCLYMSLKEDEKNIIYSFIDPNESKKLAKKRAKNVRNELVRNGIDKKRLKLKTTHLTNCEEAKNKVVFYVRN